LPDTDIVTGAFSYTGHFIAQRLLTRGRAVRTLSRTPAPAGSRMKAFPLQFNDTGALEEALRGSDVLYNTYWIRFERGEETFERAVENTRALIRAAVRAGVRRVVHVSVTHAEPTSRFPYFRGKASTEEVVRESGISHAIVRPTWIFGANDILVNNVAWLLRRFPVFLLPAGSGYEVRPIAVEDVADICVAAGQRSGNERHDAAGPERLTFDSVVRLLRAAVESRARLLPARPGAILLLARFFNLGARDVLLTRDELMGLRAGLLDSDEPPLGKASFTTWIDRHGNELGKSYVSELARNFRPYAPV
jgi:uncharacterized protein YbjT (DUF2867 family)